MLSRRRDTEADTHCHLMIKSKTELRVVPRISINENQIHPLIVHPGSVHTSPAIADARSLLSSLHRQRRKDRTMEVFMPTDSYRAEGNTSDDSWNAFRSILLSKNMDADSVEAHVSKSTAKFATTEPSAGPKASR